MKTILLITTLSFVCSSCIQYEQSPEPLAEQTTRATATNIISQEEAIRIVENIVSADAEIYISTTEITSESFIPIVVGGDSLLSPPI